MRNLILIAIIGMAALFFSSCDFEDKAKEKRDSAISARADTFARAEKVAPLPEMNNFPARKALVEYTLLQDRIDTKWYIYILGDTGNIIGYYVGKTRPINSCNFLSSTEDVSGTLVLTAPSLDGIFYGGAGGCRFL